jgi:hypothetical protein
MAQKTTELTSCRRNHVFHRKLVHIFIAILLLAVPLASAQEAPPAAETPEASEADLVFMELLQRLQNDAKARDAVRGLIQLRIEQLRTKTGEEKTEVEKVREELDAKYTRVEELKNQVDRLNAELESARAELLELDLQIPELTRQIEAQEKKHAEFAEPLSVYERSLKLLDAGTRSRACGSPGRRGGASAGGTCARTCACAGPPTRSRAKGRTRYRTGSGPRTGGRPPSTVWIELPA